VEQRVNITALRRMTGTCQFMYKLYRCLRRERYIRKAFLLLHHVSYVDVMYISEESTRLDNIAILPTNLDSHSSNDKTVKFPYEKDVASLLHQIRTRFAVDEVSPVLTAYRSKVVYVLL
jgi:hypothetical protein